MRRSGCKNCGWRGYVTAFRYEDGPNGYVRIVDRFECVYCSGKPVTDGHNLLEPFNEKINEAVRWLKTAELPLRPFTLNGKRIEHPAEFFAEVKRRPIYCDDRTLLGLFALFGEGEDL